MNEDFWIGQIHALRVLIDSMRGAPALPKSARVALDQAFYAANRAEEEVRQHAKAEATHG